MNCKPMLSSNSRFSIDLMVKRSKRNRKRKGIEEKREGFDSELQTIPMLPNNLRFSFNLMMKQSMQRKKKNRKEKGSSFGRVSLE